ncbi:MAG TPA: hypothetical protein PKO06_00240 [Candidatus Ozemobacteraceae bacterium]|nr:hypothetical protein [Candidatus Ozemobacteraceae bacterium]
MANPLPVPPAVALSGNVSPNPVPVSPPPNLTVVPTPSPDPKPIDLLDLYKTQQRECWMCKKAAADLEAGKTLDEEYAWHFVTCVLSWAHLNPAPVEA